MPPAESPAVTPASTPPSAEDGVGNHSVSSSVSPATSDDPASASATLSLPSPPYTEPANGDANLLSAPGLLPYPTPLRQHRRTPSQHRKVKETLDAVSQFGDDEEPGFAHHKINQYTIQSIIGRGSYGSVHLATDQYGKEYAVKEFSKMRLRNRARSNIMKQGPFHAGRSPDPCGNYGPSSKFAGEMRAEATDSLYFIREEIAIMKKLNHPNLVELIEVLDDPDHDYLYMVLEMCRKGVIMDVGLGKVAAPYDAEACRCWFRDMILGIEYLHTHNVIHRDIKPDNLLITTDDVLKIADFGVSEIFKKPDGMRTSKTAGSPAFFPPELCVPHHGDVAGPPCDIWAMGITLYCLRYGHLPFESASIIDICTAISNDKIKLPEGEDKAFIDLMDKILEKNPSNRITMDELREHPWVTMNGTDPLLSKEENCAHPVEPPNALELNHAFTKKMSHLLCVLKAIRKFKGLLASKKQTSGEFDSFVSGIASKIESTSISSSPNAGQITEEEVQRLVDERRNNIRKASLSASLILDGNNGDDASHTDGLVDGRENGSGIDADRPTLFLGIGTGGSDEFGIVEQPASEDIVSESPTDAGFDIYDRAFQSEVERIRSYTSNPTVYPNNFLERRNAAMAARLRFFAPASSTP